MKIAPLLLKHRSPTRAKTLALHLAAVSFVSACGSGTTEESGLAEAPVSPTTSSSGPSLSAAQLTNDTTNSLSFAQAVAAGDISAEQSVNNEAPAIGPANPLAIVDTTDANQVNSGGDAIVAISPATGEEEGSSGDNNTEEAATESSGEENGDTSGSPDESIAEGTASTENTDTVSTADNASTTDNGQEPDSPTGEESNSNAATFADTNNENAISATEFESSTSPGFDGQVLDDAIRIEWPADPDARGYNVYRQADYYTTVFDTEFTDTDVFDGDYYYEIQAFDNDDTLYYIATGLTVSARTLGRTDPDALTPDPNLLDDYELVFADEFNGSELDSTKWNTSYLWGDQLVINSEEQFYVDINNKPDFGYNPFTFDGESLTINSIKTPDELRSKAMDMDYLSGVITSYDAFKFTYGYAEVRAKMTHGRGYWPAFWLLNAYYVDDKPEIDIMEFIGDNQDAVYATYHYFDADDQLRSTKSQPTPGVDYTNGWHTYSVDWRPGTLVFYIDGLEVHRVTDAKVSRQEMYVIANTAMGGWWAGAPDESTPFPGEFKMDYIRVYQRNTPFDDVLLNDGLTELPFADEIQGINSRSHRPPFYLWPEGYPDAQ